MEPLEKLWIENLAKTILKQQTKNTLAQFQKASGLFLEELSCLLLAYVSYFNEIVSKENPTLCCQIFKLGVPHPRLILSKGNDKLIIETEGKGIQMRMLQVHFNSEHTLQTRYFDPELTPLGPIAWRCQDDGLFVNPKFVIENYLASFLVSGCKSFKPTFPKLVAVDCEQEISCS